MMIPMSCPESTMIPPFLSTAISPRVNSISKPQNRLHDYASGNRAGRAVPGRYLARGTLNCVSGASWPSSSAQVFSVSMHRQRAGGIPGGGVHVGVVVGIAGRQVHGEVLHAGHVRDHHQRGHGVRDVVDDGQHPQRRGGVQPVLKLRRRRLVPEFAAHPRAGLAGAQRAGAQDEVGDHAVLEQPFSGQGRLPVAALFQRPSWSATPPGQSALACRMITSRLM